MQTCPLNSHFDNDIVVVVVVVVDIVVVALIVVTGHIKLWLINVKMFVWWVVVVVCKVILVSNPTTVLRLCCFVLSLGL